MGARQSKRSVDITTTPKKEGIPAEGGVVGDAAAPGDGKLERIEEADTKPTTNGIAPHTDTTEDKEKDKDEATEKDKEKEQQPQQEEVKEVKAEETKQESTGESPAEVAEVTTPTEATPASPDTVTSPDNKEAKKKDKKKKWSFRSISFSKKDKTKPNREETPKNGDVTKEEPLAEGGEEAENATAASSSPLEEKSEASSPSADEQVAAPVAASAAETKEETAAASPAAASPVEEKKEEPTPSAPTPVPSVEDKKEEAVEKVEAEKKVVEVSQSTGGQSVTDPVEVPVYRVQPVATPSIIERKTSEELPSLPPSSPPPTPIDPSPLQQARQAAASATALAEALKLPAEAVDEEESTLTRVVDATSPSSREENLAESIAITTPAIASLTSPGPSADSPPTIVPAKVECPPVVEARIEFQDAKKVGEILASSRDNEEEAGKVESVSESLVAMEEVSECREEGDANRVEEAPLAMERDETIDNKNTQSEVGCPLIPKEIEPFVKDSLKEGDSSDEKSPASNMIETRSMVKNETTVPVVAATDELMNQTLPVVECQIKNEINTRADPMKTNVSSNSGFNENLEAEASTEIETNDACSAAKQHLSSENFKTEKMAAVLDETTRHVERLSDSDLLTVEKCVNVETEESSENLSSVKLVGSSSRELERSEAKAAEQLCGKLIEIEHDYAQDALMESKDERVATVTSPCELFMNSEEGPLSVSEDILVEAIPAMIIPEDDSIEELTDTTESVKVIPETDEERLENEPESDTALPTEETLISEELEDMSVPEESLNEFASVPGIMKDEAKTVDVEDTLRFPPPEDLVEFLQIPEFQGTVSALEPIEEKSIVVSITETETAMTSLAQAEIERCFLSPKDRVTPSDSCPLDSEATQRSRLSDAPTCTLSPGFENVPISLEDLPPAPEDTDSQTLDSFDYPLPPEELSCPSPPVVPANASIIEPPPPSPPASVEHAACPRDPTETLLTPPVSPSSHNSNVNTASGIATNDLTMTNSCDQSDVESKESLAAECPAKTESQDGALCQLSNTIPLTAAQEHHQNAPEVEAPVENNIAHDISTTESLDEAPKVAPPAVPTEAPASPPTAPAITEDVASVTKAIEEIDISDKAVAAAVNEAIECNTNEIIADAHHQNNINE